MIFNERLIDSFGEEKITKLLSSPDYLEKLVLSRLNRDDLSTDSLTNELAAIDAVDNYIAKMILNDPTKLDKNSIIKYRDILYNKFIINPQIAYDSILFRKDIAIRLFTKEQVVEIASYKLKTSAKVCNNLNNILNNPNNSINDEIIRFAIYQIGISNDKTINFLDQIYKYLINNMKFNNSYFAKEFILKYSSYLASVDLGIPQTAIYISNYKLFGQKMNQKNLGTSFGNTSVITINRDSLMNDITIYDNLPSIYQYIMVVSHETKHSAQSFETSKNTISKSSFEMIKSTLFSRFLSSKDYDEYHSNYIHSEIESDANNYGWFNTYRLASKYSPDNARLIEEISSKRIKNSFQELTATKLDNSTKKHEESYHYNVTKINQIIKEHPELLSKYSVLKEIYHSNGQRRSFIELLQRENSLAGEVKDNISQIYSEYYKEIISNGEFLDIDPNILDEETAFLLFDNLIGQLIDEYKNLKDSIKIYNKYESLSEYRQKEFLFANQNKVNRIKKIISYLNKYNDLINRLSTIDTLRDNNKRAFGFRISFIDKMRDSLYSYLPQLSSYGINDEETIDLFNSLKECEYNGKNR